VATFAEAAVGVLQLSGIYEVLLGGLCHSKDCISAFSQLRLQEVFACQLREVHLVRALDVGNLREKILCEAPVRFDPIEDLDHEHLAADLFLALLNVCVLRLHFGTGTF